MHTTPRRLALTRSVPAHGRVTQAQARSEAYEGGGGV
jgi:hypothetical protein